VPRGPAFQCPIRDGIAVAEERPAFWELASPGTALACHAAIRARFPGDYLRGTCGGSCRRVVLPAAGLDIDLPVVQARCCQAQQNDP